MVLGVGNLLLGDDGVGVHVVQRFESEPSLLPPRVVTLDGGTFGLDLVPHVEGVGRLVIVDAVAHGELPGHIGQWHGDDVARIFSRPLSVHQAGVDVLLGALILSGRIPPEVVVVGVEPLTTEPGMELSPPVAAALPELMRRVCVAAGDQRSDGESKMDAVHSHR